MSPNSRDFKANDSDHGHVSKTLAYIIDSWLEKPLEEELPTRPMDITSVQIKYVKYFPHLLIISLSWYLLMRLNDRPSKL